MEGGRRARGENGRGRDERWERGGGRVRGRTEGIRGRTGVWRTGFAGGTRAGSAAAGRRATRDGDSRGNGGSAGRARAASQEGAEPSNSFSQGYEQQRNRFGHGETSASSSRSYNCDRRSQRNYPIGYKKLEELLALPPNEIALSLNQVNSGYKLLLEDETITNDKMCLLIQVLSKAVNSGSCRQTIFELFSVTFCERFINRLVKFQITMANIKAAPEQVMQFYMDQFNLLKAYFQAMPFDAVDKISELFITIELVLPNISIQIPEIQESMNKYKELIVHFNESLKLEEEKKKVHPKDRLAFLDKLDPNEDYRQLTTEPTIDDINLTEPPFVRRNIIDGRYKDVNTYLDVQFRLLREDFVRPLREGIQDYRNNPKGRNMNVRIYTKVTFVGSEIKFGKMIFSIQLQLPKGFNIETSKRLLFGNLICLTTDNFASFHLATIADKDEKKLRKGIIGISLLGSETMDLKKSYTVAESRTFFIAYKHVLTSLQRLDQESLVLAEHIVFVQKNVNPPAYLLEKLAPAYDISVLLDCTYMKATTICEIFPVSTSVPPPLEANNLKNVPVLAGIHAWPTKEELNLDDSQLEALHAALTKRLAIIQGPPGTGKTFLGLKITQVLLHNSEQWIATHGEDPKKPPILVVCYTNHALDQFLEGMMSFTNKIVRIGGRSKSEQMQNFQINKLISQLSFQKKIPTSIHTSNKNVMAEVKTVEFEFKNLKKHLESIQNGRSLLKLKCFSINNIISPYITSQFPNNQTYLSWIIPLHSMTIEAVARNPVTPTRNVQQGEAAQSINDEPEEAQEDDDTWRDAMELLREEERDRMDFNFEEIIDDSNDNTLNDGKLVKHAEFALHVDDYDNAIDDFENGCFSKHNSLNYKTMEDLRRERHYLKMVLAYKPRKIRIPDDINVHTLSFEEKCACYASWKEKLENKYEEQLNVLLQKFKKLSEILEEVTRAKYLYVARQADVVGMTTTGAAQHHAILQDLQPKIVIIEEAAEILEAHVLTSLTTSCEHLIMIGDHQQLKPSPAVYELAKKYNMETSLFERMINNGLTFQSLRYQHRMRPEISRLLVPSIYPRLLDDSSVHGRPDIRGMTNNVFFISHNHRELADSDDNSSHSNPHEAALMMQLARHLILQGYEPQEITVLTPYSGQFFLLKQEQRKRNICLGIRISIVDSFQGEENDIILISLVRSNETGSVGFLKIENRVCVALSRAKLGLYIVGNLDQLCASTELWRKIRTTLEDLGSVGDAITLQCLNHPEVRSSVKTCEELLYHSPEGGCRRPCDEPLPSCTHPCPRMCHTDDPNHENVKCLFSCESKCDASDHPCRHLCWKKPCPPCDVIVNKTLPCLHQHKLECNVKTKHYKCPTDVQKEIPTCKHIVEMPCHQDSGKIVCPISCATRLDCGHSCKNKCHVKKDPKHEKYTCLAPCARSHNLCSLTGRDAHPCKLRCADVCQDCMVIIVKKATCGHTSKVKCSFDMALYECNSKCKRKLPCDHTCPRLCYKTCGGCKVMVEKTIEECGHQIKVECQHSPAITECIVACEQRLQCGHPCKQPCRLPCDQSLCNYPVTTRYHCPQGHVLVVPCNKMQLQDEEAALQKYCSAPCAALLSCKHVCTGTCGSCLHGRLHCPCTSVCDRPLVCGHICKSPCSAACPPCQQPCRWQCQHSKCKEACGYECTPCKEVCEESCKHVVKRCGRKCGESCPCVPCEQSCSETLKCGHPCVGLCGDACPRLCRTCDADELQELLFGDEDEPDARFVQLTDCKHVVEYEGLKTWLTREGDGSIQMKRCPKCQQPIYNSRRFKEIILKTYDNVKIVIAKQYAATLDGDEVVKRICEVIEQPVAQQPAVQHIPQLRNAYGLHEKRLQPSIKIVQLNNKLMFLPCIKKSPLVMVVKSYIDMKNYVEQNQPSRTYLRPIMKQTTSLQWHLYNFQIDIIETAFKVRDKLSLGLRVQLDEVISRAMAQTQRISDQFMLESSCELQRLATMETVELLRKKINTNGQIYLKQVNVLMKETDVFTSEVETKVKCLLREAEKFVGGLGISDDERIAIVRAMGGAQGHWYKCPKGHIYYIGNCGGAVMTASCNECGATIGGGSHRLASANEHAREMDGSRQAAWPPH